MKWTEYAIQDLKKYSHMKASLDNIASRIEALEEKFTGINSVNTTRIPSKGGGSKWEDFLLDNIVERKRQEVLLKANRRLVGITEKGLAALNDTERLVLDRFFMNRHKDHLERLMKELHLEQAQVYRIKDQALYKFTINMYGIMEY